MWLWRFASPMVVWSEAPFGTQREPTSPCGGATRFGEQRAIVVVKVAVSQGTLIMAALDARSRARPARPIGVWGSSMEKRQVLIAAAPSASLPLRGARCEAIASGDLIDRGRRQSSAFAVGRSSDRRRSPPQPSLTDHGAHLQKGYEERRRVIRLGVAEARVMSIFAYTQFGGRCSEGRRSRGRQA